MQLTLSEMVLRASTLEYERVPVDLKAYIKRNGDSYLLQDYLKEIKYIRTSDRLIIELRLQPIHPKV